MKLSVLTLIVIFLLGSIIFQDYYRFEKTLGIITTNRKTIDSCNGISDQTQFFIGSISKQFTAYLVIENITDIDKCISDFLNDDDLDIIKSKTKLINSSLTISDLDGIKIKHLLSHSSGYLYDKKKRIFDVGKEYSYDNCNYILLGNILEKITEKPFKILCEELFKQVGLKNTFLIDTISYKDLYIQNENLRKSMESSGIKPEKFDKNWQGISYSGGIISTAQDLIKWCEFLEKRKAYEKMLSFTVNTDIPNTIYGFGILFNTDKNIIWHHGVLPISKFYYVGALCHKKDTNQTIVWLENVYNKVNINDLMRYTKAKTFKLIDMLLK